MNPSTREETFMRGISNVLQGEDSGVSIAPSSRTEYFLNEILEAASGGGGGGGGDALSVKMTKKGNTYSCDKTYAEISAAYAAGTPINAVFVTLNTVTSAVNGYYIAYKIYDSGSAVTFYILETVSTDEDPSMLTVSTSSFTVSSGGALTYTAPIAVTVLGTE